MPLGPGEQHAVLAGHRQRVDRPPRAQGHRDVPAGRGRAAARGQGPLRAGLVGGEADPRGGDQLAQAPAEQTPADGGEPGVEEEAPQRCLLGQVGGRAREVAVGVAVAEQARR